MDESVDVFSTKPVSPGDARDPHSGRREPTPIICPLPSVCMAEYTHLHYIHTKIIMF